MKGKKREPINVLCPEEDKMFQAEVDKIDRFYKCDFRVGEVEQCEEHPGYVNMFKIHVYLGQHKFDDEEMDVSR